MKILDRINSNQDLKKLSNQELVCLSQEIRELIIDVVSKNGGHLASNLGVVELTLALHYVYNSPDDKILWDVGHQAYVHKIITDRKDRIYTIRKKDGLAPFMSPKESCHDGFVTGHAGNILSAATGIAEGKKENRVIAVLGDASMASGPSLEAINNIGGKYQNLTIVINDNEMSIGENVGAFFKYMSKIMSQSAYNKIKEEVEFKLKKTTFGKTVADVMKRVEHSVRYFISPGSVFQELGFEYVGPIDGHNIEELIKVFNDIKNIKSTTIIHVKTKKGKGYTPAEENKEKFHGISPFDVKTGEIAGKKEGYSNVFGRKIVDLAEKNKDIYAISAGMVSGTGLSEFFKRYPERAVDVGIAEEHAVTFAAGLATTGKKPFVAIYSSFLQRAYDQIVHDVAIQSLPVAFLIDRAGIVGEDGATHQGIFDNSYLSHIPNTVIMAPATKYELEQSIGFAVNYEKGPVFIRIPRSEIFDVDQEYNIEEMKWNEIKKGKGTLIIAAGSMLKEVLEIEEKIIAGGITPTIVSPLFLNPLDEKYILNNIDKYEEVIVIEENVKRGGFGSCVLEFLNEYGKSDKLKIIALSGKFIEHGKRDELLEEEGLKGDALLKRILERRNKLERA